MKLTTYKDYLDKVYEEFEDVDEQSIRAVVRHGLAMLAFMRNKGQDIYINNNRKAKYYYFGDVSHTQEKRYRIMYKKLRNKLRIMSALRKEPFDSVYYFSLTEEQYQQHLNEGKVDRVILYRLEKEAKLSKKPYVFKFKIEDSRAWFRVYEDFDTTNAETI